MVETSANDPVCLVAGRQLFVNLGANNALFLLAMIASMYCAVAALFGLYGRRIRERSPIADRTWTASLSCEMLVPTLSVDESILAPKEAVLWNKLRRPSSDYVEFFQNV